MAIRIHPTPIIIGTIREGLSARQGLIEYRRAGGKIRDSTWYKLHGQISQGIEQREDAITSNLDTFPSPGEITNFPTVTATGVLQQVEIYYRIKGTGELLIRPFSVAGDTWLTKQDALDEAIRVYQGAIEDGTYEEQVFEGAIYTGSYQMTPGSME